MKPQLRYSIQLFDNTPVTLQHAPEGWQDSRVKLARSDKYRGLIKSFTFPFKFVLEGAKLLRGAFYQYGIRTDAKLYIDRLDPNANIYNRIFTGKIDFSKVEDTRDNFSVNAVQNDISAKIAAYEGVKYAIPVDVGAAVMVTLPPLTLKEQASFIIAARNNPQSDTFPGLTIVTNQQNSVTSSIQEIDSRFKTDPDYGGADSDIWFYKATTDTSVRFKIDITDMGLRPSGSSVRYAIELRNQYGLIRNLYTYEKCDGLAPDVPIEIHQDFVIQANKGDKLFLYFDSSRDGQGGQGFLIGNVTSTIELTYDTTSPASKCKALPVAYVYSQLLAKINGGDAVANSSDLLTSTFGRIYLTCSNAIRGNQAGAIFNPGDSLQIGGTYVVRGGSINYGGIIYTKDSQFKYNQAYSSFTTTDGGFVQLVSLAAAIYISFKDFYQSVRSWMGGQAGFGIENGVARLEDLRVFYREAVTAMDAGSITDWNLTPAADIIPNSIKVGYNDQQYDTLNGSQEVNSEQRYTTPVDTLGSEETANELDLISVIRADPYGIEQTRIQPVDSSASRSDNDTFAIWLQSAPSTDGSYYPLDLSGVVSSGVPSDFYNWKLSPKQNLLRGTNYLASLFWGMKSYRIRFESGEKNTGMVVIDSGVRVAEGEDLLVSSLGAPIFLPFYTSVNVGTPINALEMLQGAAYGVVRYQYLGRRLQGFIDEVSVDAGVNDAQVFKLLLSPTNGLLKLIR